MYEPMVSIIIPVFNGSNYLKECIDSALGQTYKNLEVIVVNDGSTDNGKTENVALSYGERVKYYFKDNGGVASALNYGISVMNGEWFSWLSHDDLYLPNKIESQIKRINALNLNKEKTIISCNYGFIDAAGNKVNYLGKSEDGGGRFTGDEMFLRLFMGKPLNGCSLLIPKKALLEVKGFNNRYRFIQDFICWVDLALKNNEFYLYDEELVKSRLHGQQDTIRLSSVFPIEIDEFLDSLVDKLGTDMPNSEKYLKTILLYYCTRTNNIKSGSKIKSVLVKSGSFGVYNRLQYIVLSVKGKFLWSARVMYRKIVNKQFRS